MADQDNQIDWMQRAREAYSASTTYFDANIRGQIEADLRQAAGQHPSGSKYHSDAYKSRSKLFRNKTRAAIRRNEAIGAAAFFSTDDVISITPQNDDDPFQLASAEVMKELMQYRLTKSIPWFMVCMGALQDAQTVGVVASKQDWKFSEKKGIDRPDINLIPVENLRIDAAAKWYDPINTSPYVVELIPMYVKDVLARMKPQEDGKTKWKKYSKEVVMKACKNQGDTIRLTRENKRTDSTENSIAITEYSIVWVHENIMEEDGEDVVFYTLGTELLLTDPKPLNKAYFHGRRPYVIGCAVIDTHKIYPSSLPNLTRDTQAEINEVANQRIDNVKFAMNKRYFVRRNKQVDLRSLVRNVPSSVTLMDDPKADVEVVNTPDVTSSSYMEQDRLNVDFDEIAGTFSQASVQSNRNLNETVGGMQLISDGSNQMTEYMLRTFTETWVEPVLRQIVLMEQYYETDETVIALCGQKAQLRQKFGLDAVTDDMLMHEFTTKVNVGIGATNPQKQAERFIYGLNTLAKVLPNAMNDLNVEEVTAELFGKLGYKDGKRFFNTQDDPRLKDLQDQVAALQQQLALKEDPALTAAKVNKLNAEADLVKAETVETNLQGSYEAMQGAQVLATAPQIAPIADAMMAAAGFQDAHGDNPNFPAPATGSLPAPVERTNTSPEFPPVPPSGLHGIETERADGVKDE